MMNKIENLDAKITESSERLKSLLLAPTLDNSYLQDYSDAFSEIFESGKEDFIRRQAEAHAEAYIKALRSSPILFERIVSALASLCGNKSYNSTSCEDTINDYVRDILGHELCVRDQTRQGLSKSSQSAERGNAGELDIQIRINGLPFAIYEGLLLKHVNEKSIHDHIKKATINYNPQGVKEVFIVAYVTKQSTGFGRFWERFTKCVRKYHGDNDEHQITWDDNEKDTGLSAIRSIHGFYQMNGVKHNVYVIATKLME